MDLREQFVAALEEQRQRQITYELERLQTAFDEWVHASMAGDHAMYSIRRSQIALNAVAIWGKLESLGLAGAEIAARLEV